jgi:hypothetical protein
MGYSPNQQLFVALQYGNSSFSVFNGLNFSKLYSIKIPTTLSLDRPMSFSFAPDNSFLVVGTQLGNLLSYRIDNNIIDTTPGKFKNNVIGIKMLRVSSTLQIAAVNTNNSITFYTLNPDKSWKFIKYITFKKSLSSVAYNPSGSLLLVGF